MPTTASAAMRPAVSFITLAVGDVTASTAFYRALGLVPDRRSSAHVAFFQLNGVVLALWGRDDLIAEVGGPVASQSVVSHNVRSVAEIDGLLERVVAAGGVVRVPRGRTPWGGQRAWFADLDGHLWELVYNPGIHWDDRGGVWLDGPVEDVDG